MTDYTDGEETSEYELLPKNRLEILFAALDREHAIIIRPSDSVFSGKIQIKTDVLDNVSKEQMLGTIKNALPDTEIAERGTYLFVSLGDILRILPDLKMPSPKPSPQVESNERRGAEKTKRELD
jgi:hypothetical protein